MQDKWITQSYQSGSQVVTRIDDHKEGLQKKRAYFYVYGGKTDAERAAFCDDLCAFMNGGERPEWFHTLKQQGDRKLVGLFQLDITVCGPLEADASLNWKTLETQSAKDERRMLMCKVLAEER